MVHSMTATSALQPKKAQNLQFSNDVEPIDALAVLDLLANGVEIGRSWEALPRLLGCSMLGHLLWECVGADVAN